MNKGFLGMSWVFPNIRENVEDIRCKVNYCSQVCKGYICQLAVEKWSSGFRINKACAEIEILTFDRFHLFIHKNLHKVKQKQITFVTILLFSFFFRNRCCTSCQVSTRIFCHVQENYFACLFSGSSSSKLLSHQDADTVCVIINPIDYFKTWENHQEMWIMLYFIQIRQMKRAIFYIVYDIVFHIERINILFYIFFFSIISGTWLPVSEYPGSPWASCLRLP